MMKHEKSMAQRLLSVLLCLTMVLSMIPASVIPVLAVEESGSGVSAQADEVEYVSLPVTIRDFAADGMLFEFNQVNKTSETYVSKTFAFETAFMDDTIYWGNNSSLGYRIRLAGTSLPAPNEYWYCVICNSDGSIKKVLPSGQNTKTEYESLMTDGCFAVWAWAGDGSGSDTDLAAYAAYTDLMEWVPQDDKHGCTISYNATAGTFTITTKYQYFEYNGNKYILGDNNGFTLLLTDSGDYVNNLNDPAGEKVVASTTIPGTQVVRNTTEWGATTPPDPVTMTLNSGAPQYVYGANLRTDLVTAELDKDKKPVYTEAAVTYLAELLQTMLQVPYTINFGEDVYYTGYYILGTKLFTYTEGVGYTYVGTNNGATYDLADVLRASINSGLGTYAGAKAKFDAGSLKDPADVDTYYEAAYYLLHYVWRDGTQDASNPGSDGYGWNTWNYDQINLIQTTNEAGEKCYVFNSGYDDTEYDDMQNVNGTITGSGAIYNTQVETITGARNPDGNGGYTGSVVYSNGVLLPNARFDPLGQSGSGLVFGYGQDAGTYCELLGSYPDRGEIFYPETNYHHTLEGHAKFIYYKDANQYFTFTGDDDVYLYINGKRVLDLGGAHSIAQVKINLNDVASLCGLSDGMTYDFDFYYMERHGTAANFGIETNIQIVDPSMLTSKQGYQNGEATGYNGYVNPNLPVTYEFGLENNGESEIQNLTFADPIIGVSLTKDAIQLNSLTTMKDLSVTLYGTDEDEDGVREVISTVAAGQLTEETLKEYLTTGLEVGEKIVIHGFSYKISEEEWERRYTDNNNNGVFDEGDTPLTNWYFFNIIYTTATAVGENNSTKELSGTSNWVVQKLEEEKMGPLSITKQLDEDASHTLLGRIYTMQVLLNGKQLPVGTEYTVDGETRSVETAGQILLGVGETAVIEGIAYGTEFQVRELIAEADRDVYRATYEAVNATATDDGVTGTITEGAEAKVTVTNHTKPGNLIETNKYVTAGDTPNEFTLTLESFVKGELTNVATTTPADFVLVLDQSASMYAPAGGKGGYDNSVIIENAYEDSPDPLTAAELDTAKAQHMGYYVAQSYSGRPATQADGTTITYYDWFVVQYINNQWYYVRMANTSEPVKLDVNYSGATSVIGETLVRSAPIESFHYYRSGYGVLYDSVHTFVKELQETGVDHRVAVVGFASPFYDAMEFFDGSGVYVDGEYYLYDTEYLKDSDGTYSYIYKQGQTSKYYLTAEQIAALPTAGAETVYDQALVSVLTGYNSIENSLNAVTTNYWHTCPAAGLDMANHILEATPANGRNRTVILFTDGVPTIRIGANYENAHDYANTDSDGLYLAYKYWTVAQGKDNAMELAYETKNTYGVNIHTVGTAGAEADKLFLSGVSSDYPDAQSYPTYWTDADGVKHSYEDTDTPPSDEEVKALLGDPIAEPMFSHFVDQSENLTLDKIFEEILQSTTTLNLGADAVLREVLTDYFELQSNDVVDVTVYTAPYDGSGGYGEKQLLETAEVTLSSSDGSTRMDTIEVTGYDYAGEFVSDVARQKLDADGNVLVENYYGSKLIVEVQIETREGFWGGNNVPTNEDTTAIYEKDGDLVDKFPEPQVNVPLSLTIEAEDAVVYYGSEVLPNGLLTGLTAGGLDVVINEDGSLSPQAEWMDDFATLTWTGTVEPNEALSTTESGDYIYSAKLVPNTDGSSNTCTYPSNMAGEAVAMSGMQVEDTSHVDILVPVIPFQDSTINKGDSPDQAYFNKVNLVDGGIEWVLMDDIQNTKPATHGTAPALSFTYDPDTGDDEVFDEATPVEVTIQGQYGGKEPIELTGVSYFDWVTCHSGLHDEPTIALHAGSIESQNEFWIHVADAPDSGLVTDKYVEATSDPNEFVLTLEGYALGQQESVTVTKPADIVLVLDHSGSMRTPAGATEVLKSGTLYTGGGSIDRSQISVEKAKHRGYYVAQSAQISSEGNPTYTWFVMEYVENYPVSETETAARWVGYSVPTTESIVDTTGEYTEHTQTLTWVPGEVDGRLVFYKSQYAVLYDAMLDFVADLKESGTEHNVAIVGFAGSEGYGTRLYVGSEGSGNGGYKIYKSQLYYENTTQERREELYRLAMKNVQDTAEYAELVANINLIETNHSFTCPTAGLQLANEVFAANDVELAERDRIVVLFTDGIPNRQMGEDGAVDVDETKQAAIYDEIVAKAYETKNTYGAQVYSICTTTVTGSRDFLNYSSSNYPDAQSCSNPSATAASSQYFHEIKDFETLSNVFKTITQSTTSTSVSLDETAILKEVLTDYFVLNPNTDVDVEIYTAAYNGDGTFAEPVKRTEAEGFKYVLSSSDGSERMDTIEVTGFDYAGEYVSNVARTVDAEDYYGSKLIVKVKVRTRDGFWGGNNVPTNDEATGIYSPEINVPVEDFPEPEVNVPVDVDIVAKDKTVYYGTEGDAKDLIDKVTVDGVEVTVNDDGTFTPAEDWMNDYADLTWTEASTEPGDPTSGTEPRDYTFEVQIDPKYDGTQNRQDDPGNIAGNIDGGDVEDTPSAETSQTASDTGHVFILVPELTFKDSVTEYGTLTEGYDFNTNDYVSTEWVFMEDAKDTANAPAVSGTAPGLVLEYTPETDTFTGDTKVDVDVFIGNMDITDLVVFDWEKCEHELHGDCGTIGEHKGSDDSHEFWVHVTLKIVPDTVVIDFGLPVDIHPLENDLPHIADVTKSLVGIGDDFAGTYTGAYGVAQVLDGSQAVRYTLNTSNGMQMSKEETFGYRGEYVINGKTWTAESTITVIPATVIYYEDSFLTYKVFDYETMEEITADDANYADVCWVDVGDTLDRVQGEDRPGADVNDALAALDADNIYGYDAAYGDMNTYSLGSAKKMTVDANVYGTAGFTFAGTGFDVVSLTDSTTGTIMVMVWKQNADGSETLSKTLMVDTYYGYKYVLCNVTYVCKQDADGKLYWDKSVDSEAGADAVEARAALPEEPTVGQEVKGVEYCWFVNPQGADYVLYQVPVMKVEGLEYGTYRAEITISYADFLDHNDDGQDTFYLDAIRIYDPANDGQGNQTIEDAYVADGEGWPSYQELRNLVISADDFNALEEGEQTEGIIFIDNTLDTKYEWSYSIGEYTNFGPNNELYLAPGQSVAFELNAAGDVAAVHLALKTVGGTSEVAVYGMDGEERTDALGNQDNGMAVNTATDLYYDITALNGKTVVIANTAESGSAILSITNIKTTYKTAPAAADETTLSVSRSAARLALDSLEAAAVPELVNPFSDVDESMYCYEPILWAVNEGITTGMSETLFAPNGICNRAQVVTFLWRAAGCPEPNLSKSTFVDVQEDTFYFKPVLWAVENGITNGTDATHFSPDAVCNRAAVVTFLHRAMGSPAPTTAEHPFTDVDENAFYYDAMLWAVENGITNGMTAVSFAPTATCTRGQVVTFLYRAYN